jgi:hypothetical protein
MRWSYLSVLVLMLPATFILPAHAAPVGGGSTPPPPPTPTAQPPKAPEKLPVTQGGFTALPLVHYEFNNNLAASGTGASVAVHFEPNTPWDGPLFFGAGKDGRAASALTTRGYAHARNYFRRSAFTVVAQVYRPPPAAGFPPCEHGVLFRSINKSDLEATRMDASIGPLNIWFVKGHCGPTVTLNGPDGGDIVTATKGIEPGKWGEIIVSYDGSKKLVSIYIDGQPAGSGKAPSSIFPAAPESDDFVVMGAPFWHGILDDFKFYDYAYTPPHRSDQIQQ